MTSVAAGLFGCAADVLSNPADVWLFLEAVEKLGISA
jgi:hypothetical protein